MCIYCYCLFSSESGFLQNSVPPPPHFLTSFRVESSTIYGNFIYICAILINWTISPKTINMLIYILRVQAKNKANTVDLQGSCSGE